MDWFSSMLNKWCLQLAVRQSLKKLWVIMELSYAFVQAWKMSRGFAESSLTTMALIFGEIYLVTLCTQKLALSKCGHSPMGPKPESQLDISQRDINNEYGQCWPLPLLLLLTKPNASMLSWTLTISWGQAPPPSFTSVGVWTCFFSS